jgi:hypothetical protein
MGYTTSNWRMIVSDELERIRKEIVMTCFMVLSQYYLPGGCKKNHEKTQSE